MMLPKIWNPKVTCWFFMLIVFMKTAKLKLGPGAAWIIAIPV